MLRRSIGPMRKLVEYRGVCWRRQFRPKPVNHIRFGNVFRLDVFLEDMKILCSPTCAHQPELFAF